jgi:hypothetical protein
LHGTSKLSNAHICGDATLPTLIENGENKIPLLNVFLWLTDHSENFIFPV